MIIDDLKNVARYESIVPGIREAVNEIQKQKKTDPGRYELKNGYYMLQEGTTIPLCEGRFEAHERYIDVQILLSGDEIVEWAYTKTLEIAEAYNPEKDFKLMAGTGAKVEIKPGMFYILFPEDAHKPCCHKEIQSKFKKIVLKLPL